VLEGNDTLVPNDRLGIKMMMIIKAYHNKKCPKVPSNHNGGGGVMMMMSCPSGLVYAFCLKGGLYKNFFIHHWILCRVGLT